MKSFFTRIKFIQFTILLFSCWSTLTINAQDLLREPYLQTVWADSAMVIWKTDISVENCSIKYSYIEHKRFLFWKRKVKKSKTVAGIVSVHNREKYNEVVLKNLNHDTKYFYEIYSNGKKLAGGNDYYFITTPKKKGDRFSFYALGDIGAKQPRGFANESANEINKFSPRPDFGLGLGDIVYPKGSSKSYDTNLFKPFEKVFKNIPFYPVLGNHDWLTSPEDNFEKEWCLPNNEHYFAFEYSNAYFIGLDSRDGNFYDLGNQTEWLKKELEKVRGKYDWVIVYLHHNGKTCTYKKDYEHVIGLYDVFANYNVDLVLNGHAHTYERLKPYDEKGNVAIENNHAQYKNMEDAFVAVTLGAGGKLNKKWKPDNTDEANCTDGSIVAHAEHVPSFSIVEIEGQKLILKAINSETGEVFDEFLMEK